MNGNSSYSDSGGNNAQCGHDFPGTASMLPAAGQSALVTRPRKVG